MNIKDLYIDFFVSKGHKQIPSAPIVPENDPSVLFNTAGMQPLVPYLMGEVHPYGTRLCDYQKCLRTTDLEEIGDTTHHTFFEMLGNWSLGDYFKKESISWSYEFLTSVLKIPKERLAVTVYAGSDLIPFDKESYDKWIELGIDEKRIAKTVDDNFWIAGETGPCGPDTEIFYFRGNDEIPESYDLNDERWVEIWNNVFMQYYKAEDGSVTELPKKNVDTGMGVERITAVLEGVSDNYKSSIWSDVIDLICEISNLPYEGNEESMRIIADHIRTSVFISADPAGIKPSNTDQGYILRRLIRRAIRHAKKLNIDINSNWEERIAKLIINKYRNYYKEIDDPLWMEKARSMEENIFKSEFYQSLFASLPGITPEILCKYSPGIKKVRFEYQGFMLLVSLYKAIHRKRPFESEADFHSFCEKKYFEQFPIPF
ncbi:hypothetical protein EGR52_03815 [bacterium]|nr:hypothetical protein [bacterium]